jgi:DNA-binding GntR family transcriptional regulator
MLLVMPMERPALNPDSVTPLYEQAADWIAAHIADGRLQPGEKLPSERYLSDDWEIGYQTIRHAIVVLRERGLVVSRQGKGTFIAAPKG